MLYNESAIDRYIETSRFDETAAYIQYKRDRMLERYNERREHEALVSEIVDEVTKRITITYDPKPLENAIKNAFKNNPNRR